MHLKRALALLLEYISVELGIREMFLSNKSTRSAVEEGQVQTEKVEELPWTANTLLPAEMAPFLRKDAQFE